MVSTRPIPRYLLIILGAAILALYGLTYRGTAEIVDEQVMLNVTANLFDEHLISVKTHYPNLVVVPSDPNARVYSKYALAQSLVAVPFYAIGSLASTGEQVTLDDRPVSVTALEGALAVGSVLTMLTVFGIYSIALELGFSPFVGVISGILYAVTTIAWLYAKTFFSEPLTAFTLCWVVVFVLRTRRTKRLIDGLLTGAFLGVAILSRTTAAVFIVLLALYLLPDWNAITASKVGMFARLRAYAEQSLRTLLPLAPGIAGGLGLSLAYNLYRYGNLLTSGYEAGFNTIYWDAIGGFLYSPGRSIFLYNPVLLLAIPGTWWLFQRARREAVLFVLLIALQVAIFMGWYAWDGAGSYGPRFMVQILPIAMCLVMPMIERVRWRPVLAILAVLGFGLQLIASSLTMISLFYDIGFDVPTSVIDWSLDKSFIAHLWSTFSKNPLDSLLLHDLAPTDPFTRLAIMAILTLIPVGIMLWVAGRVNVVTQAVSTE